MKVCLVTPAGPQSRSGNRRTANRWARILRELGHRVTITQAYEGQTVDAMVAIHAWRSAESVLAFRARFPQRPLVVLLAGTDIYRFQHTHADTTLETMDAADRLVGLHERVNEDIPARFAHKLRVVFQSALPLSGQRRPLRSRFQVCVVGHLRAEKDSLRTALAASLVPERSKLEVVALGRPTDDQWRRALECEVADNPRFKWLGEVPNGEVRKRFGRAHAMVISSVMEGGANVVSEAMVAGVPVIASKISGNVGLLGDDHPAYFPAQDEAALAEVLWRAETDPKFLGDIVGSQEKRTHLFAPEREREAWRKLLAELA